VIKPPKWLSDSSLDSALDPAPEYHYEPATHAPTTCTALVLTDYYQY